MDGNECLETDCSNDSQHSGIWMSFDWSKSTPVQLCDAHYQLLEGTTMSGVECKTEHCDETAAHSGITIEYHGNKFQVELCDDHYRELE